jgi:hypothetical protein
MKKLEYRLNLAHVYQKPITMQMADKPAER